VPASEPITIDGLSDFRKALKDVDGELAKLMRVALNEAAEAVAQRVRPQFPHRLGYARKSVRASSTQKASRVRIGGTKRAKHPAWLDFGGRVGRKHSVSRPFKRKGRYLFPTYEKMKNSDELTEILDNGLQRLARQAGLHITKD